MSSITETIITNITMVRDPETGKVLAQRRVNSWPGVAFPGGHLENGESLVDSAIREVYEETGLKISDLKFCGNCHWCNVATGYNEIIFFYKTDTWSGELHQSEEGENFWVSIDELRTLDLASGFEDQLELFLNDNVTELLCKYDDDWTHVVQQWF